jgi:hypothetical protein
VKPTAAGNIRKTASGKAKATKLAQTRYGFYHQHIIVDKRIAMSVEALLKKLQNQPEIVEFAEVIAIIAENYAYTPVRFTNGSAVSEAGTNEGSCKIFAFARLHNLGEAQTLACFGKYYREDVLQHPDGSDHANIRNFMQTGWAGVQFDAQPLRPVHG